MAKLFANKFTHVSPVWLQLKPNEDKKSVQITGGHDIDSNWLNELREINPSLKIVPRIIFEDWNHLHLIALLTDPDLPLVIAKELAKFAIKNHFDGYVIEVWTAFASQQKKYNH